MVSTRPTASIQPQYSGNITANKEENEDDEEKPAPAPRRSKRNTAKVPPKSTIPASAPRNNHDTPPRQLPYRPCTTRVRPRSRSSTKSNIIVAPYRGSRSPTPPSPCPLSREEREESDGLGESEELEEYENPGRAEREGKRRDREDRDFMVPGYNPRPAAEVYGELVRGRGMVDAREEVVREATRMDWQSEEDRVAYEAYERAEREEEEVKKGLDVLREMRKARGRFPLCPE